MQDNYNFDDIISGKVKDHETEFSDDAWKNMQAKLDHSERKSPKVKMGRRAILVLLLLITLSTAFVAGYLYRNSSTVSVTSVVSIKKADVKKEEGSVSTKHDPDNGMVLSSNENKAADHVQLASISKSSTLKIATSNSGGRNSSTNLLIRVDQNNISDGALGKKSIPADKYTDNGKNANLNSESENKSLKTRTDSLAKPAELKKELQIAALKPKTEKYIEPDEKLPLAKHPISFGPYFGIDYDMTYSLTNGTSSQSSGYSVGAFINFPINDKISIQSGLGYNMISNLILLRSDTVIQQNDIQGKVYQVTDKSTWDIEYLNLPIIFKYKISPKFRVLIGPQISYALTAPVYTNTLNYKKDQNGNYTLVNPADTSLFSRYTTNTSNFNSDISRFNLQLQTGLQWNMSKSFDLSLMYYIGLTNTLKNKDNYIFTVGNENNTRLQLRIGYKLFHKKFYED